MGDGSSKVPASGNTWPASGDPEGSIPELQTPSGKDAPMVRPRSESGLIMSSAAHPSRPSSQGKKEYLTKPSEGTENDGYDNEKHDLIVAQGDVIGDGTRKYTVISSLGQGTFGQVFKCSDPSFREVALKVIKNQPAFYHQARTEIGLLKYLNSRIREFVKPGEEPPIVQMMDCFQFRGHLCLVFELLGANLYELIRHNEHRGVSINLLHIVLKRILEAMHILKVLCIIHCDLKPENVLLNADTLESPSIKVIDFGSACVETKTTYQYIQSRFYRSPEVVLGAPYNAAADMWSFGCMAVELFYGLPLFPGACEYDLLSRIMEMFGPPPRYLLELGKCTHKFFKQDVKNGCKWTLRTKEDFEEATGTTVEIGKRYWRTSNLHYIIHDYRREDAGDDAELQERASFANFLCGCLKLDPRERWTPSQALKHPFITGEKFDGEFIPPPDPEASKSDRDNAIQKASNASRPEFRLERAMAASHYSIQPAQVSALSPGRSLQAYCSNQMVFVGSDGSVFSPPGQQTGHPPLRTALNIPSQGRISNSGGTFGSLTHGSRPMSGVQAFGYGSMKGAAFAQSYQSMGVPPTQSYGYQHLLSNNALAVPMSPLNQQQVNNLVDMTPDSFNSQQYGFFRQGVMNTVHPAHPSAQWAHQQRIQQQQQRSVQYQQHWVHHQQHHPQAMVPWTGSFPESRGSQSVAGTYNPHQPQFPMQQHLHAAWEHFAPAAPGTASHPMQDLLGVRFSQNGAWDASFVNSYDTRRNASGHRGPNPLSEAERKGPRVHTVQEFMEAMSVVNHQSTYQSMSDRTSGPRVPSARGSFRAADLGTAQPSFEMHYRHGPDGSWNGNQSVPIQPSGRDPLLFNGTNGGAESLSQVDHVGQLQLSTAEAMSSYELLSPNYVDGPSSYLADYDEQDLVDFGRDTSWLATTTASEGSVEVSSKIHGALPDGGSGAFMQRRGGSEMPVTYQGYSVGPLRQGAGPGGPENVQRLGAVDLKHNVSRHALAANRQRVVEMTTYRGKNDNSHRPDGT
eukprot:jgi/Botrbrau1/10256/Bobra.0140s0012.1